MNQSRNQNHRLSKQQDLHPTVAAAFALKGRRNEMTYGFFGVHGLGL